MYVGAYTHIHLSLCWCILSPAVGRAAEVKKRLQEADETVTDARACAGYLRCSARDDLMEWRWCDCAIAVITEAGDFGKISSFFFFFFFFSFVYTRGTSLVRVTYRRVRKRARINSANLFSFSRPRG